MRVWCSNGSKGEGKCSWAATSNTSVCGTPRERQYYRCVKVRPRPPDLSANRVTFQDLPTRANSCLTALTCDQVAGNILVAGFGDGGVKVYDRRLPARENMIRNYKGWHHAWIVNAHMQRGGNRELVTGR